MPTIKEMRAEHESAKAKIEPLTTADDTKRIKDSAAEFLRCRDLSPRQALDKAREAWTKPPSKSKPVEISDDDELDEPDWASPEDFYRRRQP